MTGPEEPTTPPEPASTQPTTPPEPPTPPEPATRPQPTARTEPGAGPVEAPRPQPAGVPPRPAPLPPPRVGAAGPAGPAGPARVATRSSGAAGAPSRPVSRGRRARLTLRRIDPWSVFLYSVVASLFLGVALLVCVGVLYALLSSLGVLDSVNTLVGDVTADPASTSAPSSLFSAGRVMSVTAVVAAANVVLLTGLATLGAFLYNLCSSLTGGIELTFGDRE